MEIAALGAAREVGRSAFLVKGKRTTVLLDFGVLLHKEPLFPMHVRAKDVDGIVLSHGHLDHSGGVPLFFIGDGLANLYATPLTVEISKLLIEDFLKISGFYLPFEFLDLLNMLNRSQKFGLDEEFQVGEFRVKFLEGGHLPGGASILLEDDRTRLLYTGDIDAKETSLLRGADTRFGELDFVITESTYALADHPPRGEVEREFVDFAKEVVERGGTLLVPAFSVGRSQEVVSVLRSANFPYTVAMDGMALKANEILLRYQEYLRDPSLFRKSLQSLEVVASWSQRRALVKSPSVIVSPAGMLVGGASVFYNNEVAIKPKNAIAIVSYQVSGTPGRTLLEKGLTVVNGKPTKVKAEVRRFDFSAHSGRSELFSMFKQITGNPKVITIHGDRGSCVRFADELREQFGLDAVSPQPGEGFTV